MQFDLDKSLEILERTPDVLENLLNGLSADWIMLNEGGESWSVYDIIGHFIHGEKTDWIPRARIILSDKADKSFEPFDRFAMFRDSQGKSLQQLLQEFKALRDTNLEILRSFQITEEDLKRTGLCDDRMNALPHNSTGRIAWRNSEKRSRRIGSRNVIYKIQSAPTETCQMFEERIRWTLG